MMLAADELAWFSDSLHALYAAGTAREMAAAAIGAIGRRFELVFIGCEEIGHTGKEYALHGAVMGVPLPAETPAYLHDHPVMAQVHDMPALAQLRGRVSRTVFERTDYFNGIARPMGFNDHVILRAQRRPTAVTLSLCRDKIFTPPECELLRLLQPHLDVAWQRTKGWPRAAGATTLPQLRLSPELRPVNLSALHHSWLKLYFPDWRHLGRLPERVHDWVVETRRELQKGLAAGLPRVLAMEAAGSTLLLRYFPVPHGGSAELHLAIWRGSPAGRPREAALSPREQEVLRWIAEGKRDAEIAVILGLAPKTVSKHVEHVLAKLHVTNRTAALALG